MDLEKFFLGSLTLTRKLVQKTIPAHGPHSYWKIIYFSFWLKKLKNYIHKYCKKSQSETKLFWLESILACKGME